MKPQVIRVDQPTPCFHEVNRDVFEQIIDISVSPGGSGAKKKLRVLEGIAKGICAGCPERQQCFSVHGQDDRKLGVVAGATDRERADIFGDDIWRTAR